MRQLAERFRTETGCRDSEARARVLEHFTRGHRRRTERPTPRRQQHQQARSVYASELRREAVLECPDTLLKVAYVFAQRDDVRVRYG